MLTITRKIMQSVVFSMANTNARLKFTVIEFKHHRIAIRWEGERVGPRTVDIRVGEPHSFLFCGRKVQIYVLKVAAGQTRLQFDADRCIQIDRPERLQPAKDRKKLTLKKKAGTQ